MSRWFRWQVLRPGGLRRWEVALDGRTFRFLLKKDAEWVVRVGRTVGARGRDRWTGRTWQ